MPDRQAFFAMFYVLRTGIQWKALPRCLGAPSTKSRGEGKTALQELGYRARCWVCERTHSWMNRLRRILIRWEKKQENYRAMLQRACAFILWRNCPVSDRH